MNGFVTNIEKATLQNTNFRKVLYTSKHSQLVLMCLKPNEEIGSEIHTENDQFFRFEQGQGKCIVDGNEYPISNGTAVVIPVGSKHNIINTGKEALKLYTVYSPPNHKDGTVHRTKADAEANEEHFDGVTSE